MARIEFNSIKMLEAFMNTDSHTPSKSSKHNRRTSCKRHVIGGDDGDDEDDEDDDDDDDDAEEEKEEKDAHAIIKGDSLQSENKQISSPHLQSASREKDTMWVSKHQLTHLNNIKGNKTSLTLIKSIVHIAAYSNVDDDANGDEEIQHCNIRSSLSSSSSSSSSVSSSCVSIPFSSPSSSMLAVPFSSSASSPSSSSSSSSSLSSPLSSSASSASPSSSASSSASSSLSQSHCLSTLVSSVPVSLSFSSMSLPSLLSASSSSFSSTSLFSASHKLSQLYASLESLFPVRQQLPHVILYGPPGTGKSSCAKGMRARLNSYSSHRRMNDWQEMNASDERSVEIIRTRVATFAQSGVFFFENTHMDIRDEHDVDEATIDKKEKEDKEDKEEDNTRSPLKKERSAIKEECAEEQITAKKKEDVKKEDVKQEKEEEEAKETSRPVRQKPLKTKRKVQVQTKIAVMDEMDSLLLASQRELMNVIEEYGDRVLFVLITNHLGAIYENLRSMCEPVPFVPLDKRDIHARLQDIANYEKVVYDQDALWTLTEVCAGDLRRGITLLQRCSTESRVTTAHVHYAASMALQESLDTLYASLKHESLQKSIEVLQHTLQTQSHLTVSQLVQDLQSCVLNDTEDDDVYVTPHAKLLLVEQLAKHEQAASVFSNQSITLSAVAGSFKIATARLLSSSSSSSSPKGPMFVS